MSKELSTLANAQLPAHVQGASAEAAALVTSESVPRITLRDASFVLKKDGNEIKVGLGKPIQVVILGIDPPEPKRTAKQFYEGSWSEDSADAPDCFSRDGVRPDPSVAEPYCDNCAQCPNNAWGSGHREDGSASKGKACSDRKNLMVVLAGKHIDGDVFTLSVPPTSLKSLSTYGRELVRYNVNMHTIVTEIGVDQDDSKAMSFGYAGYLDEQPAKRMIARAASAEIQEMVHPAGALPAPTQAAPGGSSLASPAAAEVDDELDLSALGGDTEDDAPAATQRPAPAQRPANVQTTQNAAAPKVDSQGCPWDARIHSANKSVLAGGQWRLKRGVAAALVEQVMSEICPDCGSDDVDDEPAQVEGAEPSIDDLLDDWGTGV